MTFDEQVDAETLIFSVGEDCPYYDDGYTSSKLYFNLFFSSTVIVIVVIMVVICRYTSAKLHIKGVIGIEIEGPGGELYVKLKQGTMLPDCDFETGSCGWNDAVELNSTEFFRFTRTKGSKQ